MESGKKFYYCLLVCAFLLPAGLLAQLTVDQLHGDERYSYKGLHSGNMIRTTFHNDGQIGERRNDPETIGGEWPINSGRTYLAKLTMFVGSEVKDVDGAIKHIVSEGNGTRTGEGTGGDQSSGDAGPNGEWWTMAPLPGFADESEQRIAMSHWRWSWPETWPDKFDDVVDPGWPGSWNGYFGKGVLNADQESYYVMDDYLNKEFAFYPDSTDNRRRGLGLRVNVRGFQWSNVLVEDCLFLLYDVHNIGTYSHDKMNFGTVCGATIGAHANISGDSDDDGGAYNLEEDLGYQLDEDDIGAGGWSPVGWLGLTFFETPGNPFDGIDNDGDGALGSGSIISEETFVPVTYDVGDQVVLIDYNTFERSIVPMPAEGVSVEYLKKTYIFLPGQVLEEIPHNLIDDNLNGIIDESTGITIGEGEDAVHVYLYLGLKYIDYHSGAGLDNILIDEERDDNIDNDGDWDILTDDVGLDGVPRTGDPGEGDGVPSSGRGTDLPGEPHIDKTDIDESDMIGLTCFNIHEPSSLYPLWNDEVLWEGMLPGLLIETQRFGDTDIILGSGFFPLIPDQIERFSVGYIYGYHDELFRNRDYAELAYKENYNFSKAPNIPTVTVLPGDNMVTLFWDDFAEKSVDPITGDDFEGYRIYRSTDPGWNDNLAITDSYGSVALRKPIAQFDLVDDITGYAGVDVNGVHFWRGDDTGLVHNWTDSTAKNGYTYYYAVTAYDRGSDTLGIAPSETSKYISITKDGEVDKGNNVVIARPEAPVAGFVTASVDSIALLPGGTSTGVVGYEVIDQTAVKDNHIYRVTFEDSLWIVSSRYSPQTKSVSLIDVTVAGSPDTLIDRMSWADFDGKLPMIDGFSLMLSSSSVLQTNDDLSGWNDPTIHGFRLQALKYSQTYGIPMAADYRIEFIELGLDSTNTVVLSATKILPGVPSNVKVTNMTTGKRVKVGLWERDGSDGAFSAFTVRSSTDQLYFFEPDKNDSLVGTWMLDFDNATADDSLYRTPGPGDVLEIYTRKPFLSQDVYEFTTHAQHVEVGKAKVDMDRIRVVPNPYVVANSWEPLNPYSNGRGPRELHFIHLPEKCTIRIFNIRGQLVRTLEHESPTITDGTEIWDMQTKDRLDISYGVYIYHVDAGELGEKTGKFAVVK